MNIDDQKRTRSQLKGYFVKNAIPTESQFAQFIDSGLNQREDGLVKLAGDALSIESVGDDTSFKKALNLYLSFTDASPAWSVALRPRANPADPATGALGFSIIDGAGNNRLSISTVSGNVGIGTATPAAKLDVQGALQASGDIGWGAGLLHATDAGIELGGFGAAKALTPYIDFHFGNTLSDFDVRLINDAAGILSVQGQLAAKGGIALLGTGIRLRATDDNGHVLRYSGTAPGFAKTPVDGPVLYGWDGGVLGSMNGGEKIELRWNASGVVNIPGSLGIGTGTPPAAKLQVTGGAIMPSAGSDKNAGIYFPENPGGGGGDAAWLRYFPRSGEACSLELGVSNDADDDIFLNSSGSVVVGFADRTAAAVQPTPAPGVAQPGGSNWAKTPGFPCLQVRRENTIKTGGKAVFLELYQDNPQGNVAAVYPSLRWHHNNIYWYRLEGREDGLHVKVGNVADDGYAPISSSQFRTVSDASLKTGITPIRRAGELLDRLQPVRFRWLGDGPEGKMDIGVLAQEVEAVLPELVSTGSDGIRTVNYGGLSAVLLAVAREQQAEIAAIKARLSAV